MFSTLRTPVCLLAAALGLFHSVGPASRPPPVLAFAPARTGTVSLATGELSPAERELVERINAERTARGLEALTSDPLLVRAARAHSDDMCTEGYFSHIAPAAEGRTPMDRYLAGLHALGLPIPRVLIVGENIYYCSAARGSREAALAHRAFMNSPAHRANILGARYRRVGVGVCQDARGRFWVTEMFVGE